MAPFFAAETCHQFFDEYLAYRHDEHGKYRASWPIWRHRQ